MDRARRHPEYRYRAVYLGRRSFGLREMTHPFGLREMTHRLRASRATTW